MSDLKDLQQRALEIREKYGRLESKEGGREWDRKDLMMGFVGDVGDLIKLVQAKEGVRRIDDVDAKLAHELADCLWSVLVLAEKYGVDIEAAFTRTMSELDARITEKLA